MILNYDTATNFNPAHRQSDFEREPGKVSCNQSQVELSTNPEKAPTRAFSYGVFNFSK